MLSRRSLVVDGVVLLVFDRRFCASFGREPRGRSISPLWFPMWPF